MNQNTTPEINISGRRVFLFYGVVGAGKGTQVELLEKYFAEKNEITQYLSPGNFFRQVAKRGDITSQKISKYTDQGLLVPDFVTISYANSTVLNNYSGNEHLIFDGYPRSIAQSEAFEKISNFYDWEQIDLIMINISEEEAVRRLVSRGRHDDTPEGIAQRVKIYKNQVLPSLEYLKTNTSCKIHEINGEQSIEAVHADIMTALRLN